MIRNAYQDRDRAEAYARLEFDGTYYLAYRDIPQLISEHVTGRKALDFGCGTGRSTRFLRKLGFEVVGIDISEEMVQRAKEIEPDGDYRLISPGDFSQFQEGSFDLILCAFPFDNIPGMDHKVQLFGEMGKLLAAEGRLINLVSAPEIYLHEWTTFSTKDFPENRSAKSQEPVRIIITGINDQRPVTDFFWSDKDYRTVYSRANLSIVVTHKPLGRIDEPFPWVNETRISPWVIYVLTRTLGP